MRLLIFAVVLTSSVPVIAQELGDAVAVVVEEKQRDSLDDLFALDDSDIVVVVTQDDAKLKIGTKVVQTVLLGFFLTGVIAVWPLVDSLVRGHDPLPFLVMALFWFGVCWYVFWRHISSGMEVLNSVEEVILSDD